MKMQFCNSADGFQFETTVTGSGNNGGTWLRQEGEREKKKEKRGKGRFNQLTS